MTRGKRFRRAAYDEDYEDDDAVDEFCEIISRLSDSQKDRILDHLLSEIDSTEEPGMDTRRRRRARARDEDFEDDKDRLQPAGGEDRRRRAEDDPPEFRGMPRPGGGMVEEDRRHAFDAMPRGVTSRASFAERFPGTRGIKVMGNAPLRNW